MLFTNEKVFDALKGMDLTKTPRVNDFVTIFFQMYWHIAGLEVSSFCLDVLNNNVNLDQMNITNVVLIPKVQNPNSMVKFRLISLRNVIYKIIAKMIGNRFQKVLNFCIYNS